MKNKSIANVASLISEVEKLYELRPDDFEADFDQYEELRFQLEKFLCTKGYNEESTSDLIEDLLLLVESFKN